MNSSTGIPQKLLPLFGGAMSVTLLSYGNNNLTDAADSNAGGEFFVDASQMRSVPDNQEMFFQPKIVSENNSNHNQRQNVTQGLGGACLIIELLARQSQFNEPTETHNLGSNNTAAIVANACEALNFFFRDLAGAAGAEVVTLPGRGNPTVGAPHSRILGHHMGCPIKASSILRGVGLLRHSNNDGSNTHVIVYTALLRIPPPYATEVFVTLSVPEPVQTSASAGVRDHTELYCPEDVDVAPNFQPLEPTQRTSRALAIFDAAVSSILVKDFSLFVLE